jgi:hypothetical protein
VVDRRRVNSTVGFLLEMIRVFCAVSILSVAGVVIARGQQPSAAALADADKAAIVESVLTLELQNQNSVPDFANIRDVSSENIEFVEPSQLSPRGFTLVAAADLRQSKNDRIVIFLLFRNISLRDGVAVVKLSRMTEGRPCFGAPISIERTYTYESRRTDDGWVAELTRRPKPPVPVVIKYSAATD